ncbi:hypothetical protein ACIA8C_22935 [Nocardia sp. NPDC051321]|uniref:hypothetical protein n=1 Tax=Nocardia sp. NPDC051321 TaxID=3364323 RepID=UPI003794A50C
MSQHYSSIHSVEKFLTGEETAAVIDALDVAIGAAADGFDIRQAPERSVHEITGHSPADTVEVFEPAGRTEMRHLPSEAIAVLNTASDRALPKIQAVFPFAEGIGDWIYIDYGPGQFVTPHIDYPSDPSCPGLVKYAAISVTLQHATKGGEFFVETISDPDQRDSDGRVLRDLHWADRDFRERSRTRWLVRPGLGDAILWGTEVSHGTRPVHQGCERKLIAFVQAGNAAAMG